MSKEFLEKFGNVGITKEEMREHCKRPGTTDKDGEIQYFTEQAHKEQCDVNNIIRKYDKNGLITHVQKFEARFGDMTGPDFKESYDKIMTAIQMFGELPSAIRNRFDNQPAELLRFMDNPENRKEAIELGIIKADWTEATDGLGEHVKQGENIEKKDVPTEQTPKSGETA